MLLRFSVENYRSIRDPQELLLTASERVKPDDRRGPVFPVPAIQEAALPAVALYGSNASGKSNILEALAWMKGFIVISHAKMNPGAPIQQQPFLLDDDSPTKPTRLECTFTLSHGNKAQPVYTYGFTYTAQEICEEWLYQEMVKEERDDQLLFRRTTNDQTIFLQFDNYLRGENEIIEKLTRPNSLFLSAAAQNNHPQLSKIYKYFYDMELIKRQESLEQYQIAYRFSKSRNQKELKNIFKQADVGIADIVVRESKLSEDQVKIARNLSESIPQIFKNTSSETEIASIEPMSVKQLGFVHSTADGKPRPLPYDLESRGTQVFLTLLLPALDALSKGSFLVIDELDSSLHPDLSRAFLSLFCSKESNPHGAQILFSTHDVTLLDSHILQQDEIWFTDKDPDGASRLTPLTDFELPPLDRLKPGAIEQAYRLGRFGGVPSAREFLVELNPDQEEEE